MYDGARSNSVTERKEKKKEEIYKYEKTYFTRVRHVIVVNGEIVNGKENNHQASRLGRESIEKDIRQEGTR